MIKKLIISLLSVMIIITTLNIIANNRNSAHAFLNYMTYSCSIHIESIERTRDYIANSLVPGYYQNINYAGMYSEYRENFLDLADRQQQHIINFTNHIFDDIKALASCNGVEELSEETLVSLLQSVYAMLSHPNMQQVFTTEFGVYEFRYNKLDYYKNVFKFFTTINNIESKINESRSYNNQVELVGKIFGDNPDGKELAFITVKSIVESSFSTFIDLTTFREQSMNEYDGDVPDYVKAVLWLDRINMIFDLFEDRSIEHVSKSNNSLIIDKIKGLESSSAKFIGGNIKDSIIRGVATEAMSIYLGNNVPASEQEVLTEFAGNFAAILTAGNRIGLALVYAELNADLMAYVNRNLEPVWESADVAYNEFMQQQQQQKMQLANELHYTSTKLMEAKLQNLSDDKFTNIYFDEINKFETKLKKIYHNNNDKNFKIYMDGYLLRSEVAPFVQNGVTMVPLRLIAETMNVTPIWNQQHKTITITTTRTNDWPNREVDIVLTVNEDIAKIHTRNTKLNAAPVIKEGTTFVPLRFIAEALSLEVKWYEESKSIVLTSN